jgi:hypothetical protein
VSNRRIQRKHCTNKVSKFVICGELYGDTRVYCARHTKKLKDGSLKRLRS